MQHRFFPPCLACLETMAAVSHSISAVTMPTVAAAFCGDQTHWVTPDECAHGRTHKHARTNTHACTRMNGQRGSERKWEQRKSERVNFAQVGRNPRRDAHEAMCIRALTGSGTRTRTLCNAFSRGIKKATFLLSLSSCSESVCSTLSL